MLNDFEMFSQSINDQVFPLVNEGKKQNKARCVDLWKALIKYPFWGRIVACKMVFAKIYSLVQNSNLWNIRGIFHHMFLSYSEKCFTCTIISKLLVNLPQFARNWKTPKQYISIDCLAFFEKSKRVRKNLL